MICIFNFPYRFIFYLFYLLLNTCDGNDAFWCHSMLVKQSISFSRKHQILSLSICVHQTVQLSWKPSRLQNLTTDAECVYSIQDTCPWHQRLDAAHLWHMGKHITKCRSCWSVEKVSEPIHWLAVWLSGNALASINVVVLSQTQLVTSASDTISSVLHLHNTSATKQGHCGACRRKWRLTDTDLWLVARPRQCLTLSNPVPWQNWMAAYLGYTLRMKALFRGWPIMVNDTHTRRRRRSTRIGDRLWTGKPSRYVTSQLGRLSLVLCRVVKWVSAFGLSNNNTWRWWV